MKTGVQTMNNEKNLRSIVAIEKMMVEKKRIGLRLVKIGKQKLHTQSTI